MEFLQVSSKRVTLRITTCVTVPGQLCYIVELFSDQSFVLNATTDPRLRSTGYSVLDVRAHINPSIAFYSFNTAAV